MHINELFKLYNKVPSDIDFFTEIVVNKKYDFFENKEIDVKESKTSIVLKYDEDFIVLENDNMRIKCAGDDYREIRHYDFTYNGNDKPGINNILIRRIMMKALSDVKNIDWQTAAKNKNVNHNDVLNTFEYVTKYYNTKPVRHGLIKSEHKPFFGFKFSESAYIKKINEFKTISVTNTGYNLDILLLNSDSIDCIRAPFTDSFPVSVMRLSSEKTEYFSFHSSNDFRKCCSYIAKMHDLHEAAFDVLKDPFPKTRELNDFTL